MRSETSCVYQAMKREEEQQNLLLELDYQQYARERQEFEVEDGNVMLLLETQQQQPELGL